MKAFITGITGQDGSYLAEFLLEQGYEVHGLVRRSSTSNRDRIAHLLTDPRLFLHQGDLCDSSGLKKILKTIQPDEIYNLAAMSHVGDSFKMAEYTAEVNGVAVLKLLESMRQTCPEAKFYQASTSEIFGKVKEIPQKETTPFHPRSPYGVSKLHAYWSVVNFREAYNLFACNGILFNHESPRRGEDFVSRKITLAAVRISMGLQDQLLLGNLSAKRDWGYAKDYVEGMHAILQQDLPEDFVLATGRTSTVRTFATLSFQAVGIDLAFEGQGKEERGYDAKTGKTLIAISPDFFRPSEVDLLVGDPTKAKEQLGWMAQTSVEELVEIMVASDRELLAHSPTLLSTKA